MIESSTSLDATILVLSQWCCRATPQGTSSHLSHIAVGAPDGIRWMTGSSSRHRDYFWVLHRLLNEVKEHQFRCSVLVLICAKTTPHFAILDRSISIRAIKIERTKRIVKPYLLDFKMTSWYHSLCIWKFSNITVADYIYFTLSGRTANFSEVEDVLVAGKELHIDGKRVLRWRGLQCVIKELLH